MADEKSDSTGKGDGQDREGHGDKTAPAGIVSPATYAPLSQEPVSTNQKTEIGRKGRIGS